MGDLTLDFERLDLPGDPGQSLLDYSAEPQSPSRERLDLLASWPHAHQGGHMDMDPKQPSTKGPAQWFTGDVWIDPIARGEKPSKLAVNAVRFTPGARTAWHSHSTGQILYVTDGAGLVQPRGGDIVSIRAGDVVRAPADEWHWHGADHEHFMTHLSITDGDATWGEHVTDEEYRGEST